MSTEWRKARNGRNNELTRLGSWGSNNINSQIEPLFFFMNIIRHFQTNSLSVDHINFIFNPKDSQNVKLAFDTLKDVRTLPWHSEHLSQGNYLDQDKGMHRASMKWIIFGLTVLSTCSKTFIQESVVDGRHHWHRIKPDIHYKMTSAQKPESLNWDDTQVWYPSIISINDQMARSFTTALNVPIGFDNEALACWLSRLWTIHQDYNLLNGSQTKRRLTSGSSDLLSRLAIALSLLTLASDRLMSRDICW